MMTTTTITTTTREVVNEVQVVNIALEAEMQTTIPFTTNLLNSSTEEYAEASNSVDEAIRPGLESYALAEEMQLDNIFISFTADNASSKRRRRTGSTAVTQVTTVFSKEIAVDDVVSDSLSQSNVNDAVTNVFDAAVTDSDELSSVASIVTNVDTSTVSVCDGTETFSSSYTI